MLSTTFFNANVSRHVVQKVRRWALRLTPFNFQIEHVPGENSVWAVAVEGHNSKIGVYPCNPIVGDYVVVDCTKGPHTKMSTSSVGPGRLSEFFLTSSLLLSAFLQRKPKTSISRELGTMPMRWLELKCR